MKNFPVRFLGGIPELKDYRRDMWFVSPALAGPCESYHADSPGKGLPSIAALAGLGETSVCDFFAPLKIRMLVVEDTNLVSWMSDRLPEMGVLEMAADFADECLRKMSGSAEVLGALYARFIARDGEENPPQADCEFWVVVTDIDSHKRDARVYDALTERVRRVLRGELSRPYVLAEIIGGDGFGEELEGRIPRD